MRCEKLDKCPFYLEKMPIDSALGAMYRKNYCETDKTKCARYIVATSVGPEHVTVDLYPNMHQRAERILASNSSK